MSSKRLRLTNIELDLLDKLYNGWTISFIYQNYIMKCPTTLIEKRINIKTIRSLKRKKLITLEHGYCTLTITLSPEPIT